VDSRLVAALLVGVALAAGVTGLAGAAFWLGLLAVPVAAGAAFTGVAETLAGRPALLRAVSSAVALGWVVLGSAVRTSAATGAGDPPLAAWALAAALLAYLAPLVAWVLEPAWSTRRRTRSRRQRLRPAEVDELLARAA
jgi:hypothetical protein